ncbi:MAG TPA: low temperature requirement protein A [Kribbella sp.]|nr:low temperature requirement protein A [Kribbella sp.]
MPDTGSAGETGGTIRIRVRMTARPIDEPHRVASQLELLFDLTFVVAVAAATSQLAHSIASGHALDGLIPFLQVFFAIWWAWMNFTWFASSYDTDDVAYRLLTMLQMAGVLVLAAGVPVAADHGDYRAVTLGYLIMRIGLVTQWLRAGIEDPGSRRTALRYAVGITVAQVGWVLRLFLPDTFGLAAFVLLVAFELAIPRWAERTRATNWHPHHIAERYGLFTIILLGESVLATSTAVQQVVRSAHIGAELITVAVCGLLLLFALWWLYFLHPAGPALADHRHRSYRWGYGHYAVFGALAALGAGLEVAVEQTGHHVRASPTAVGYAVAIPIAVFLLSLWTVHTSIAADTLGPGAMIGCTGLILLLPLISARTSPVLSIAAITVVCVLLAVVTTAAQRRTDAPDR